MTRAEVTAYCEERGLAWRDDATNAERGLRPQPGPPRPAAGARRDPPGRRRQRPAHRGAAARRGRGPRRPRRRRARRLRRRAARPRSRRARFAELPPALRRLVLQRLADAAAGRPVPGAARFADQVAGLAPRRLARSTSATASRGARGRRPARRARLSRSARPTARRSLDCGRVDDPAIGETLVSSEELQGGSPSSARRSAATTRAGTWSWSASSRAPSSSSPT